MGMMSVMLVDMESLDLLDNASDHWCLNDFLVDGEGFSDDMWLHDFLVNDRLDFFDDSSSDVFFNNGGLLDDSVLHRGTF